MTFFIDPLPNMSGDAAVSLAEVKAHLSIVAGNAAFDDLLMTLRDSAIGAIEQFTGKYLIPRTGVVWRGQFPPDGTPLDLCRGPLISVASITYTDRTGSGITLPASDYLVVPGGTLVIPVGAWPSDGIAGTAVVTFSAGFSGQTLPSALKLAALGLCAFYFENRDAMINAREGMPVGVEALARPYRDIHI